MSVFKDHHVACASLDAVSVHSLDEREKVLAGVCVHVCVCVWVCVCVCVRVRVRVRVPVVCLLCSPLCVCLHARTDSASGHGEVRIDSAP